MRWAAARARRVGALFGAAGEDAEALGQLLDGAARRSATIFEARPASRSGVPPRRTLSVPRSGRCASPCSRSEASTRPKKAPSSAARSPAEEPHRGAARRDGARIELGGEAEHGLPVVERRGDHELAVGVAGEGGLGRVGGSALLLEEQDGEAQPRPRPPPPPCGQRRGAGRGLERLVRAMSSAVARRLCSVRVRRWAWVTSTAPAPISATGAATATRSRMVMRREGIRRSSSASRSSARGSSGDSSSTSSVAWRMST